MENSVVVTDKDTIRELVAHAVSESMVEHVAAAVREALLPEWLDREQTKDQYGLTDRQLTYLRRKRRIEFSQHGRRIFYRRTSLDQWFDEGRVRPRGKRKSGQSKGRDGGGSE